MSKPQMKPTFVIGLGHIPNDWSINSVNSLCTLKGRIGWRGYTKEDLTDSGPLVIGATQINSSNRLDFSKPVYISKEKFDESPEIQVSKGDIILVKTGNTIGKVAYIDQDIGEATINPNTALLKDIKCNPKFLFYVLSSSFIKKRLLNLVTVGAQPSINQASLKAINIGVPNPKEQQKIASILSSVDKAIEKTEEIIEQTETVEDGLRQELLKKGINHTEFKDSSFGHIPASWKSTFLEEVVDINSDSISSKTDELESINYIDIASIQNNRITGTTEYAFKNAPSRARRKVKTGDIIVSTVRPYLKGFAYITEQYNNSICSTGFSVLRTKQECHSEYLYQIILSNRFVNYLISNMTGSSYPAVKADDIKNYNFQLPPLEEQVEISNILNQSRNKINLEQKKLSELLKIKSGLMQQLLTGKVRVPLNENEEVPQ